MPNNEKKTVSADDIKVPLDDSENEDNETGSGNSSGIGIRPNSPSTIKKPSGQTNMPTGSNVPDPITNPNFYEPGNIEGTDLFMKKANSIISGISLIGTIIAAVAIIVMGIRYMLASVSERAQYKETMIPYIIGAVMVFTISNFVKIIYELVKAIQI